MDVFSAWKVGKFVKENILSCENIHKSCSQFFSYYYGNSNRFSLFYIQMMEKFYSYFPIYINCMDKIRWRSYLELLKLEREECYFYYQLLLFCGDNYKELKNLIQSNLFVRI